MSKPVDFNAKCDKCGQPHGQHIFGDCPKPAPSNPKEYWRREFVNEARRYLATLYDGENAPRIVGEVRVEIPPMSEQDKPAPSEQREWFINPVAGYICKVNEDGIGLTGNEIHVIEHSAYEQVRNELYELQLKASYLLKRRNDLQAELAQARAQVLKLEEHIDRLEAGK